jgi:hypothetical protein
MWFKYNFHMITEEYDPNQTYKHMKIKYTLEKTEGAIKNEQSRETSNIGYTRHKTKTNKQNTTQKFT